MNDPHAETLNTYLKRIAPSLEEIAKILGQKELRAAHKATAKAEKAQKRAGLPPKK